MKFRNIAFSMFALILPCFIFIGCGETNLTKANYATAFGAVETTLSLANTLMVNIEETGENTVWEEATSDSTAKNLIKFLKLIMENEEFELSNEHIIYSSTVPSSPPSDVQIRQYVTYDGQDINGYIAMSDDFTKISFIQYIAFDINYDFENNKLVNYRLDFVVKMTDDVNYNYSSLYYDGQKLWGLDSEHTDYQTQINNIKSAYENNINKSAISKNYDFSEELLKVQQ